jgi:ABC-2 type transport system permease protein
MSPIDLTVMWLTWRQLFAGRRVLVVSLLAFAPALIAVIFRVVVSQPDGMGMDGAEDFLSTLSGDIVVGTILPLAAVVFGTSAFGGEVDDGTLIYLLVKPIARWRVVLSKYVVAVLSTIAVAIPAVLLPWLIDRSPGLTIRFPMGYLAGAVVGALIYSAIFLTLGIASRRALVFGLIYVIGFENVLARSVVGFKSFSVREFATTVSHKVGEYVGDAPPVTLDTVYIMGSILLVGFLLLSVWKLWRYEVAERL